MIKRELYLEEIRPFIDKPFIKVITGIRRCGKSAILMMLKEEFLSRGVEQENIIYINFESLEYLDIDDAVKLYRFIKEKITGKGKYYILLDEIQEVNAWEKAVNSFLVDFNADVYITGSNSKLLSSELATYIAGRYIEINVFPLSFSEYLFFKQMRTGNSDFNIYSEFSTYLRLGGFPAIHTADYTLDAAYKIVYDIYSSAILRDVVQRYGLRNIELLERVIKYVFDNVGNKFSAKNVADYFKSQHRKTDLNTIYNYLSALEGAFIVQKVSRYDVKGKEILQTNEKFFVGDQSLIYSVMGFRDRFISGVLENIVMLELKRRGYKVYVGKLDDKEIDFIAERKEEKIYVQVTYKLSSQQTIDREFGPLLEVKDHYPKYVLSMEEQWEDNINGVRHKHIADFLLS